jgi:hypothetical protein
VPAVEVVFEAAGGSADGAVAAVAAASPLLLGGADGDTVAAIVVASLIRLGGASRPPLPRSASTRDFAGVELRLGVIFGAVIFGAVIFGALTFGALTFGAELRRRKSAVTVARLLPAGAATTAGATCARTDVLWRSWTAALTTTSGGLPPPASVVGY